MRSISMQQYAAQHSLSEAQHLLFEHRSISGLIKHLALLVLVDSILYTMNVRSIPTAFLSSDLSVVSHEGLYSAAK